MATKTVKRITKVLTYAEDYSHSNKYHGVFHGDEDYSQTKYLHTNYSMHVPDYERLGKPKRIRVTVTVLEDE